MKKNFNFFFFSQLNNKIKNKSKTNKKKNRNPFTNNYITYMTTLKDCFINLI